MPNVPTFHEDMFRSLEMFRNARPVSTTVTPSNNTLKELGYGSSVSEHPPSNVFNAPYSVGIELEIEGSPTRQGFPTIFEMTNDGSLRNGGVEVRCRRPISGRKLEVGVNKLCSWLETSGYSLSERCSTHIHLDVTDMTPQQILNLVCISVMLEPVMFKLFGNTREANIFCMRTDMGTTNYTNIIQCLSMKEHLCHISWSKYAAVGLFRIRDLGTVEYRMFTPIVRAYDYIRVINLLFAMKHQAMTMPSPKDIIDVKVKTSLHEMFAMYFPEMQYLEEYESLLETGVRTLNDILTTVDVIEIVDSKTVKQKEIVKQAKKQLELIERGI
jgi:hypothetical protein